jgi:hypothetical protein
VWREQDRGPGGKGTVQRDARNGLPALLDQIDNAHRTDRLPGIISNRKLGAMFRPPGVLSELSTPRLDAMLAKSGLVLGKIRNPLK